MILRSQFWVKLKNGNWKCLKFAGLSTKDILIEMFLIVNFISISMEGTSNLIYYHRRQRLKHLNFWAYYRKVRKARAYLAKNMLFLQTVFYDYLVIFHYNLPRYHFLMETRLATNTFNKTKQNKSSYDKL